MEKKDLFKRLVRLAESEERVAVATIVRAYGSTPREVGAKMVVLESGDFFGTVGGGCGEADVWEEARRVFKSRRPSTVEVDLTEDPDRGGDAICGGRMEVFIDLWERADLLGAGRIVDFMERGVGVSLASVMASPLDAPCPAGTRVLLAQEESSREGGWQEAGQTPQPKGGESPPVRLAQGTLGSAALDARLLDAVEACLQRRRAEVAVIPADGSAAARPAPRHGAQGGLEVFVEVLEQPPVLVIAGAGHCALPLSRMGKMLGFQVVILDDRPECATRERFPDADRILMGDLEREVENIPMSDRTYLVLVTRGHRLDETILRRVVREPLAYVGMIGSKRRVKAVLRDMERDGYEADLLSRVHTPIGLDIGADTPEEIAVSILAEIVMVRRGGSGGPLSLGRALRARA